jgi:hypothetical protein
MCWLQEVCKVERQVVGWFEVADAGSFRPDSFPVFVLQEEEAGGGSYYGFPQANGTGKAEHHVPHLAGGGTSGKHELRHICMHTRQHYLCS